MIFVRVSIVKYELYDLEDSIAEYLNLGAEISVSYESEIEYE